MTFSRIEVDGLDELQRALRKYEPAVRKELQQDLKRIANTVVTEAKANASWSSRIPATIGSIANLKRGVAVRVRRTQRSPHGPLFERGSSRNRGQIRHPLFGNRDRWYSQKTRPFLQPAVDRNRVRVARAAREVLERVARKVDL